MPHPANFRIPSPASRPTDDPLHPHVHFHPFIDQSAVAGRTLLRHLYIRATGRMRLRRVWRGIIRPSLRVIGAQFTWHVPRLQFAHAPTNPTQEHDPRQQHQMSCHINASITRLRDTRPLPSASRSARLKPMFSRAIAIRRCLRLCGSTRLSSPKSGSKRRIRLVTIPLRVLRGETSPRSPRLGGESSCAFRIPTSRLTAYSTPSAPSRSESRA